MKRMEYGGRGGTRTRIFSPIKMSGLEGPVSTRPRMELAFSSDGHGLEKRLASEERHHAAQGDEKDELECVAHV